MPGLVDLLREIVRVKKWIAIIVTTSDRQDRLRDLPGSPTGAPSDTRRNMRKGSLQVDVSMPGNQGAQNGQRCLAVSQGPMCLIGTFDTQDAARALQRDKGVRLVPVGPLSPPPGEVLHF